MKHGLSAHSEQFADVDMDLVPTASPSAFLVQTSDAAY
jgi:hypothetical protein